jgi:hypothetical protein
MNGRSWWKFYGRDFFGHPRLREVPRSARQVLLELLNLASEQVTCGKIDAGNLAGYLAGDPEAASGMAILVEKGILNVSKDDGSVVFRRIVRDASKSREGALARLKRGDLAGLPARARPDAICQMPEQERAIRSLFPVAGAPAGAGAPEKPSKAQAAPKPKKTPEHVKIVETFQRAWAEDRGMAVAKDTPIDKIPPDMRYQPTAKDWVAASRIWKASGGDWGLVRERMNNMLDSEAVWVKDTMSVALLWSHWSHFEHAINGFAANGQVR